MSLRTRILKWLLQPEGQGADADKKVPGKVMRKNWDDFFLRAINQQGLFENGKEYKTHSVVYLALNKISSNIASVPFVFYRGDQQVFNTPIDQLFDRPNPLTSRFQLFESTVIHMGLYGEAFWLLNASIGMANGRRGAIPAEIYVVDPKKMKHVVDDQGTLTGWVYNGTLPLELNEVVHFKLYNPYDPYRGLAPLEAARVALDSDTEAARFNKAFYENDATPSLVVSIPGEEPLPNDEFLRLKAQFENRHRGSANARKVAFAQAGMTITTLSNTIEEMKYIETRTFSRDEILAVFGVPKSVAGFTEGLNRATAMAQKRSFWIETLLPYMTLIQEQLQHSLFSIYTPEITGKFDRDAIEELRADLEQKASVAQIYYQMGIPFKDINDRLNLGYEPDWVNSDVGYIPNYLIPIGTVSYVPQVMTDEQANADSEPAKSGHLAVEDKSLLGRLTSKLQRFLFEQRNRVLDVAKNGEQLDWDEENEALKKLLSPLFDEIYKEAPEFKNQKMHSFLRINQIISDQVDGLEDEQEIKTIYQAAGIRIRVLAKIEYNKALAEIDAMRNR